MASPLAAPTAASDAPPLAPAVRASRAPWLLVAAALAGGAIGWWLLDTYEHPFVAPEEMGSLLIKRGGTPLTPEEDARLAKLEFTDAGLNSGAAFAFVGAPLAALIGLTAGFVARSWGGAALALPLGAALGAVAGWAAGWAATFVNHHSKMTLGLDGMYAALLTHALAWAIVALPVGLLAWLGLRRASLGSMVGSAVLGALLAGAVAYPFVAALAFQMNNSELVVPSGRWNRLAWVEVAAALIAASMAWNLTRRKAEPAGAAT
jgi:hypothetical protein